MERLDKILSSTGRWSRREVKELIRAGRVTVDGTPAKSPEDKIERETALIWVDGESVPCGYLYLMLYQINSRNSLGYGVLHLYSGVHFHKIEISRRVH